MRHVISFLQEKIKKQKASLKEFEGPVVQELMKTSPHMQYELIRVKAQLEVNEDILLFIEKFSRPSNEIALAPAKKKKPVKKKADAGT